MSKNVSAVDSTVFRSNSFLVSQKDPHRTVQAFIDLIQRHEQSFYDFVHKVHSKGEGLFDSLMRWVELFITVIRDGLGSQLSLEFLLPHTGSERESILAEVDKVALYHYKLKVAYEGKVRRRFGRAQGQDDEEREVEQLVEGVVGELNFGELVSGDAEDLAAEETDSEEDDESSDESSEEDSSEEDSSAETSSEDESPPTPVRRPTRANTILATPTGTIRGRPLDDSPSTPKQRTLSLRGSRSSLFSDMRQAISRKSQDVPPVLPLPLSRTSTISSAINKPLPPSPVPTPVKQSFDSARSAPMPSRHSTQDLTQTPVKQSFDSVRSAPPRVHTKDPSSRKARRKKAGETIQPPDLVHIPQLLPLFKEMVSLHPLLLCLILCPELFQMRPHLRPRQRTEPPT